MQSPPSSPVFTTPPASFPHVGTPMSPSLASPNTPMTTSGVSLTNPDVLCGWLHKATTDTPSLSTGDRPKLRWFIFNDESGELEYYRTPKDLTRLGAISINDAAFLPDAVPGQDNFYCMDVITSKKTYRLYHVQKATLDYWRQALQKKRSNMQQNLMNELTMTDSSNAEGITTVPAGTETAKDRLQRRLHSAESVTGQFSSASTTMRDSYNGNVDLGPHLEVEARVHESNRFVGPHTETQMHTSIADVSVRNFSVEARNKLRTIATAFRTTAGIANLIGSPETENAPAGPSHSPPGSRRGSSVRLSQGPPKSPSWRRGGSIPGSKECEECRVLTGKNQDLEDHLKAAREQVESLKATLRLLVEAKPKSLTPEEAEIVKEEKKPTTVGKDVRNRLMELEMERERLENEVQIREDVINDKDRQLMELQNQLEALHENPFGEAQFKEEFAQMRNERNGYREQNMSLNAEVLNLRLLFSASVEHEHELIDAIKKLHEVYTQSSLRLKQRVEELSKPQLDSAGQSLTEKDRLDLLADALGEVGTVQPAVPKHLQTVLMEASGELTDEYGFYVIRQELDSQQMIDLTTLGPEVNISQYLEIPPIDHDTEASITAKWERYLDESGLAMEDAGRPLKKAPELKQLLRQGCPVRLRFRVWKALILFYVDTYRRENGGENIYKDLVEQQMRPTGFSLERKQIELDLHRSLPENKHFNCSMADTKEVSGMSRSSLTTDDVAGQRVAALKRILLSFCENSETVGYCQGLDRIAATLLLNVDEETSFWGLQVIVRRLRSEQYYTSNLRDAQVDQRVFKDLIASHVPNVSQRLAQMDVDISLFSFNWFLTLFVDGFHWTIFMKIWDSFLFEGDKVIFRYAIAVVIYLEPILLHVTDVPSMYKVLRNAGRYIKDHRRLTEIAFCSLRSFPKRRITQKRAHYAQIVDKEIADLDAERRKRRQQSSGVDMFARESEDEDA